MTAAEGASEFYQTMVGGEPRYESLEEARQKDEQLRQAYMGHQRWVLINNSECKDFKDKIEKAKEAVLDVIGKSTGTHFHKKFLLYKEKMADASVIPLNLSRLDEYCYEEIYISETCIEAKSSEGEVISCSVEKKGGRSHFTYTHKLMIKIKGQTLLKKRNIAASEYIQAKSAIKKGTKTLRTKRVCIISDGIYAIVDYFPETDGRPMLAVIQVRRGNQTKLRLPDFIKQYREVTDEPQYMSEVMSKEKYFMDAKDKEATLNG